MGRIIFWTKGSTHATLWRMNSPKDTFSFPTATAVIIANMVGTGVFTSLGFQLLDIQSGFVLLLLWAVGGLAALCGAMSYAELGAALPRSGGEYHFLSRIYHPSAGFVSGWISTTIGFAAPCALSAITFGTYFLSVFAESPNPMMVKILACGLIIVLTAVHASNRKNSGSFQSLFTALKILVIIGFCLAALLAVKTPQSIHFLPQSGDGTLIFSSAFAVSLIYVSYAYTGWNAATYLSSEVETPQKNLPRILIVGTVIVMILYLGLNYVFLKVAPIAEMQGQLEIGYIAAKTAFGKAGADFFGIILAVLLISTVSAMTMAGPRVLQMIGEDYKILALFGQTNRHGIPAKAIYFQALVALIFILTSTFERILVFAGAMLAFNSFLTVLGVFILRLKEPDLPRPYKTHLYPLTPLIYLCLTAATLVFVVQKDPISALFGVGLIIIGFGFYSLTIKAKSETERTSL